MTTGATFLNPQPQGVTERESFWSRIAQDLAHAIGQGLYAPGIKLPSEHQLAAQFGANRHTIRRALAHLGQNGLVRSTQGSGTYVENLAVDLALGKRTRHRHNLSQAGLRGELRVMRSRTVSATAEQALALQVAFDSPLLFLQVLGEGAGQALHVSERYFPLPRFAQMDDLVTRTGSITEGFAQHGVIDYMRQESRVSARLPSKEVALLLGQSATRPVLLVKSVNIDTEQKPIEFAYAWFAGDRVTLTVNHHEN
jgi:GntR family transcriptional regulator, phosphonate transport system regulatory protein